MLRAYSVTPDPSAVRVGRGRAGRNRAWQGSTPSTVAGEARSRARPALANSLANMKKNARKWALSRRSRKPLSVVRRIEGSNPSPSA
jgi:hypothetical protein